MTNVSLGNLVMTNGAAQALAEASINAFELLRRHQNLDGGCLVIPAQEANKHALKIGSAVRNAKVGSSIHWGNGESSCCAERSGSGAEKTGCTLDVSALNDTLGDERNTRDLFKRIPKRVPTSPIGPTRQEPAEPKAQ